MRNIFGIFFAVLSVLVAAPVIKDGVDLPKKLKPEHAALGNLFVRKLPEAVWKDCLPYTTANDPSSKKTCKERAEQVFQGGELFIHEAALYHYITKGGGIILDVPEEIKAELKEVCEVPRFVKARKEGKYQVSSYRNYSDPNKSANVSHETIRTFGSFQCLDKGDHYMVTDTYKVDPKKNYDNHESILDLGEGGKVVALTFRHFVGNAQRDHNFHFKIKVPK